jgi:hypothetical protein
MPTGHTLHERNILIMNPELSSVKVSVPEGSNYWHKRNVRQHVLIKVLIVDKVIVTAT